MTRRWIFFLPGTKLILVALIQNKKLSATYKSLKMIRNMSTNKRRYKTLNHLSIFNASYSLPSLERCPVSMASPSAMNTRIVDERRNLSINVRYDTFGSSALIVNL